MSVLNCVHLVHGEGHLPANAVVALSGTDLSLPAGIVLLQIKGDRKNGLTTRHCHQGEFYEYGGGLRYFERVASITNRKSTSVAPPSVAVYSTLPASWECLEHGGCHKDALALCAEHRRSDHGRVQATTHACQASQGQALLQARQAACQAHQMSR